MADKIKSWEPDYIEDVPVEEKTNVRGTDYLESVKEVLIGAGNTVFHATTKGIWLGSEQFNNAPFSVDMNGNAVVNSITLTGGVLKYGKTSFTDSTNAGYYISSSGIYFGSAADATIFKFTIGTGAMSYAGNLINASGNVVLNSTAQTILKGFDFGTTDYAGAVKAGDIAWNTTTGVLTGGSGVAIYRGGIVGANSGVTTFSIDAITGDATFAGTLSGASGTFGTVTAGTIDGCDVFANNFGHKKNTLVPIFGCLDGWNTSVSGGGTVTPYGSNQIRLYLNSASSETTYIETSAYSIIIPNNSNEYGIRWDYDPSLEFWAKIDNTGTDPTSEIRMGLANADNVPFFGWVFQADAFGTEIFPRYYDSSLHTGAKIAGYANQWHKYKIKVVNTGTDTYTANWYLNDLLVRSYDISTAMAVSDEIMGIKLKNNVADIGVSNQVIITQAIFQQKYS